MKELDFTLLSKEEAKKVLGGNDPNSAAPNMGCCCPANIAAPPLP